MNYMTIKPVDIANGEGVRVSLFVSGCSHHCKGCFNQEAWGYDAGKLFDNSVAWEIIDKCSKHYIEGLSILGGEPLDPKNVKWVTFLCEEFKRYFPHKTIWCYTGYLFEEVSHLRIMEYLDVVVDGRFVEALKDLNLKFRGSSNQRIIDVQASLKANRTVLLQEE